LLDQPQMRILSITAGAAGMYCGSCLRDNALARELLARGHEVTLLPLYTPTLTDEENVSRPSVLFGGISIYLQQRVPAFRRTPKFVDRLLDSPGLIRAFASRSASTDPRTLGDLTISMLQGTAGVLRKEFDKLVEWLRDEPVPDVINLPNSLLISLAGPLADAFGRPVCCTLQGEDLFLDGLIEPYRSRALELIRSQVARVDRFIAVSRFCAAHMSERLGIRADRMSVVPLGINVSGYERRSREKAPEGGGDDFRIGYFARVAPEKGLHLLSEAFQLVRRGAPRSRIRLEAAGYLSPSDRSYLRDIQRALERAGFGNDFTYHGALDRAGKLEFLRSLDVLSVPATYDEPKGLFLLEAMASGVPVVQPRRGGFIEVVEKTGGGLLVEPDDAENLAEGLDRVRRDATLREELARRGYEGVRKHYTIQQSADRLMEVYEAVARAPAGAR
jgi:glycosyltransferase involved in cell wall biosynthesis